MNPAALQQLAGVSPPLPEVAPAVTPKPVIRHHAAHHATLAVAAPKPPAALPVVARPAAPAPAPPPAAKPALPSAPLRLVFAPGSAALPAGAAAALRPFCASQSLLTIAAHAPATPDEPSAAMRLSLARAFAVRDALAACGVPAQDLLPRALGGAPGGDEDATIIENGAMP